MSAYKTVIRTQSHRVLAQSLSQGYGPARSSVCVHFGGLPVCDLGGTGGVRTVFSDCEVFPTTNSSDSPDSWLVWRLEGTATYLLWWWRTCWLSITTVIYSQRQALITQVYTHVYTFQKPPLSQIHIQMWVFYMCRLSQCSQLAVTEVLVMHSVFDNH